MICDSCNLEISNAGVICERCNPMGRDQAAPPALSYHDLARTVRRLKGLVLASIVFGLLLAPFAIWIATKALARYGAAVASDRADLRQLVVLRRVAVGLLVCWAFIVGTNVASWLGHAQL